MTIATAIAATVVMAPDTGIGVGSLLGPPHPLRHWELFTLNPQQEKSCYACVTGRDVWSIVAHFSPFSPTVVAPSQTVDPKSVSNREL